MRIKEARDALMREASEHSTHEYDAQAVQQATDAAAVSYTHLDVYKRQSTIVYETVRIDNEFQRVRSFTTRTKRSDDKPNQFFYLTTEELAEKRNENAVITEVIFPTTGQTYGTLAASYNGTYCILETLANSVKTVSYTHLDVYKRQALTGPEVRAARDGHVQLKGSYIAVKDSELWLIGTSFSVKLNEKGSASAVSYTHLDVYKRQVL